MPALSQALERLAVGLFERVGAFDRAAELFKTRTTGRIGRALAPLVAAQRPHLVISTHPMVSGGLAWLRGQAKEDTQ